MCVFDADSATTEGRRYLPADIFQGRLSHKLVLFRQEQKTPAEPTTPETRRLYAGRFVRDSTRNSGGDSIRELIPSQDAGDSSFRICWPSVLPWNWVAKSLPG